MRIIKFYSESCGPCKVLDANLKKIGANYESINVDDDINADMVAFYKIRSVPTLVMETEENTEVKRHTGVFTEEQLKEWLEYSEN